MLYEALVLIAIAIAVSFLFHGTIDTQLDGLPRTLFQIYLWLVIGFYFMWCWLRGGQTLPMKAWKLRVISADGQGITATQATLRYLYAWISLLSLGIGFLWAFIDKDRQFLHDRFARTRIVKSA